jgi:amino acid adenylation domain-containing protein/non-ribosomal peptide synthase protein (TIGR01720 family)
MTAAASDDDLALLDLLLAREADERTPPLSPAAPVMSRAQQRIWFLQQLTPDSAAYVIAGAVALTGHLDVEVLRRSLQEILRRHDSLRTCFPTVDGRPVAAIDGQTDIRIAIDDLTRLSPEEQDAALAARCAREAGRPFDLTQGPLVRLRLLRLAPLKHVALLSLHHIVADGWSMGVLLGELRQLYAAFAAGRPSPLAELNRQYADFAAWQEVWLRSDAAQEQRRWWTDHLSGLETLELPCDRPRPATPSFRGAGHAFSLPIDIATALREIGRRAGVTPFMTLLAAFDVLLHRYTGQDDIVVGTPASGRGWRDAEPLIGLFVNSLVMRCDLSGRPSFMDVLRRVRGFAAEALARQELPFEELVSALAPDRDLSANPLFQVMFTYDPAPAAVLALPELTLAPVPVPLGIAKFDLLLNFSETAGGAFAAAFEYALDLFDQQTVERLADHFLVLLTAMVAAPDEPVATLPLMTSAERRQLDAWNATATAYPRDLGLARLFEQQVRRSPDAVALIYGPVQLTYAELNARANRLARRLRQHGVRPATPVALHAERSVATVIGMLAVIKAGGAYVPLDPTHPVQRLERMLRDCCAPVLLVGRDQLGELPTGAEVTLCLDDAIALTEEAATDPDWPATGGDDLAYIIYTSGSTGEPKGVAVPHRGVVRLVLGTDYVDLRPDDVMGQVSNTSFDAATFEIWGALLNGARLVGIDRDVALSPPRLAAYLAEQRVSTMFLTAGLFNQVAAESPIAFGGMRTLLVGGEQVDPHWMREVLRQGPPQRLLNGYGPTENTTFSVCKLVSSIPEDAAVVPIGRPIANTRAYVLDPLGQELPIGVPGELYLAGDGLALGYYGRDDATAAAFITDATQGRLYRTGDIVRRLADGDIVFIGRCDGQVKLRGYRIELGEIEVTLTRLPGVREVAVVVQQESSDRRSLVAYVVGTPDDPPDPARLRQELAGRLPAYMVPAQFVLLPALPLNENGKLDRRALAALACNVADKPASSQPAGAREACLATVWQDVLGRSHIGIHDAYFELGGDSITAIQVVSRLRRLGWQLPVADLFRYPTIAALAPRLQPVEAERPKEASELPAEVPVTAIQRWFLAHYGEETHQFNQAILLRPPQTLEVTGLRQVLEAVLNRHDALRLRLTGSGATLRQIVLPPAQDAEPTEVLRLVDLRDTADPAAAMADHCDAIQRSLHLRHGPLVRAALFRRTDGDRLLLTIHHMAVDAVSWRILLEELEVACRQVMAGQAIELGPAGPSFRHWATRIAQYAAGQELATEASYWARIESAAVGRLPTARSAGAPRHGDAQTCSFSLSAAETTELLTLGPRVFGTEIMDLLLTALGRALQAQGGGADARITLEHHGREPPDGTLDLSRTVGWFTSLHPVVLALPAADLTAQIRWVRTMLGQIPRKGIGYGLLRHMAADGTAGLAATPQLSFNYLGQFNDTSNAMSLVVEEPTGTAIAPDLPRAHALDLAGLVTGGRLTLALTFDPALLPAEGAAALLEEIGRQVGEVVRHCRDAAAQSGGPPVPALPVPPLPVHVPAEDGEVEDSYPPSPLQQGLLFQSLIEPDGHAYLVQMRFEALGALDLAAFNQAWIELCRRHAILRATFVHQDVAQPLLVVLRDREPELSFSDLSALEPAAHTALIETYCLDQKRRGFDLQRDRLLRIAVFREAEDRHHIVWSYHHVLLDGWCLSILHRDFLQIYSALAVGRRPELPAAVSYRRYIEWLDRQDSAAAKRFWRDALAGYDALATLPRSRVSSEDMPRSLADEVLEIDAAQSTALAELAACAGVTMNTMMQALWGLLLARYNDCDEVVFGTVVSGRPAELAGIEEMVGLFINTVPVRITLPPDQSFLQLLRELQEAALASAPHQHLPLPDILAESAPGRALFDHLLTFENYPLQAAAAPGDGTEVTFTPVAAYDPTHYALDITAVPGARMTVRFTFDLRVYRAAQLRRTARHLHTAINEVIRDPARRLRDIEIVPEAEAGLVLRGFNATHTPYRRDLSFVDLFEAQAETTPDAIAWRFGAHAGTYQDLNHAVNRLAHHLRARGVGEAVPVGVCVERGPDMIAAPLAIMKAGGIFVPLAADHPSERLAFMIADAGVTQLLTTQSLAGRLNGANVETILLDAQAPVIAQSPPDNPAWLSGSDRMLSEVTAYVIFTSGSTGRPKAVAVSHGGLANMAHAWRQAYRLGDFPVRLLQMASFAFDVFVGDLVRALCNSGTLVICPAEAQADPPAVYQLLAKHRITFFESTPALVVPLMEHVHQNRLPIDDLRVLIVGSDVLAAEHYRVLLERFGRRLRLINSYGVTEATIDSGMFETDDPAALDGLATTPIGRPLLNTRFYVLDRYRRPQPLGIPGELYLGGDGVARGYVNRTELTAHLFVVYPELDGGRLYRTGDLSRWLDDGNMQLLGRIDDQVKVRGYRIELGEIEAQLLRCPGVEQAVVAAGEFGLNSGKDLVAYVVANAAWDRTAARETLRRTLPDYMVPGFFVRLDHLPLGVNGKVDRRQLPGPRLAAEQSTPSTPPRTETEARLARLWHEVLQVEAVGVHNNFFELGGHSLKAMQITARIHQTFGVQMSLSDFFSHPTVAAQASLIDAATRAEHSEHIPLAPAQEHYELSHAQQRLWMLHQLDPGVAYNMPDAYIVDVEIDGALLNRAFGALIERHETLRTAFVVIDGEPRQRVLTAIPFAIAETDLRDSPEADRLARTIADHDANQPFDLAAPPLLRASLVHLPLLRSVFTLTMHHIIGDGWSGNLVLRELLVLYEAFRRDLANPLPPLRIQYKDFAVWQNQHGFARHEGYWRDQLQGLPERTRLPYDLTPESDAAPAGARESADVEATVANGLRALAARHGTTISTVLLSLFNLLLFQWTRQSDFWVGLSVANRTHPDTESLIGFFVNILPIRCRPASDMDFDDLLKQVTSRTHEALEHQDYPFDRMIEQISPRRRTHRQPLVNIVYAFQNFADIRVDVGTLDGEPMPEAAAPNWEVLDLAFASSQFDLTLVVMDEGSNIRLSLGYDGSRFLPATIRERLRLLVGFAGRLAKRAAS